MGSQFVQGLDRDANHRLQRLLSEDPPVSGNLFTAADVIDTALVNRCLRETLSATSDQEDYSVISVLGSSRLHLSQITDALVRNTELKLRHLPPIDV